MPVIETAPATVTEAAIETGMVSMKPAPVDSLTATGAAEPPYDVAGWTLPLQMGVKAVAIGEKFEVAHRRPESARILGVEHMARIELGQPLLQAPNAVSDGIGKPLDAKCVGRLDLQPVAEIDALEHRRDLVLAIGSSRADDQREVDLRVRLHGRARASATNSCGARASARTDGSRPIDSSAAATSSR